MCSTVISLAPQAQIPPLGPPVDADNYPHLTPWYRRRAVTGRRRTNVPTPIRRPTDRAVHGPLPRSVLAPTFTSGSAKTATDGRRGPFHGPSRCRGLSPCRGGTRHACKRGPRSGRPDGSSRCIEKTRERVSDHRSPVSHPDVNVGASIGDEKGRERPSNVLLLPGLPFHDTMAHLPAKTTPTGTPTVLSVGNCQPSTGGPRGACLRPVGHARSEVTWKTATISK